MSKEIVDTFIRERVGHLMLPGDKGDINATFARIAREWTDRKGIHRFAITKENIYNIVLKGIASASASIQAKKIAEKRNLTDYQQGEIRRSKRERKLKAVFKNTQLMQEASTLSENVILRLNTSLSKYISNSDQGYIELTTAKNDAKIIKAQIFADILNEVRNDKYPKLRKLFTYNTKDKKGRVVENSSKLFGYIKTQTHFLHQSLAKNEKTIQTVGTSQAEILLGETIEGGEVPIKAKDLQSFKSSMPNWYTNGSRASAANFLENAIKEVYGDLNITWGIKDSNTKRNVEITGIFANYTENPPGVELFDWSNLRKSIEQKIQKKLDISKEKDALAKQFATGEGSQPFNDRLGAYIINEALNKIYSGKKVRVKKVKQDKPKSYKSKVKPKVNVKKPKTTKAYIVKPTKITLPNIREETISKQVTQPTFNLNALKAQINARLSMTVIKNMGTPALENRTGRFARSVQVTDVSQTSKGFPSIGYTYQKFPYQTFEPGYAQGSAQRDPRTLIDRSIRDIAQELIVGRFYTRRV